MDGVKTGVTEGSGVDEQGVDREQIRALLRRPPEQRLAALQAMVDFIAEARRGRRSTALR
ncbi:MAG: hypothetical protein R3A48_15030 [Polyangiales bacterium]